MTTCFPLQPVLQPRRFLANYSEDKPRHWCEGNAALTHILNTYTLLVPGNEGFFIRTLKQGLPDMDPEMREMVMHFSHQEGQHGAAHLRFWQILERQGYRIRGFQRKVDFFLYRLIERLTPFKLRLSFVACIKHQRPSFWLTPLQRVCRIQPRALFDGICRRSSTSPWRSTS
jgi:predicted metal-dependent hydrolase